MALIGIPTTCGGVDRPGHEAFTLAALWLHWFPCIVFWSVVHLQAATMQLIIYGFAGISMALLLPFHH